VFATARPFLVVALVALGTGCASLAKKPPTPADDITPEQAAAVTAAPGERFFLVIFGSQSVPKRAKYTHTWATAVRCTGCDGTGAATVEAHTISWMPASLDIRPLALAPEKGANLELNFTIEEMLRHDERVSVWGPYEVRPGLYQRFLVQKQFLESGAIGYQCVDTIGRSARFGTGSDCIHAVTDMDPQFDRGRYPLSYFGEAASEHIVKQISERPVIIEPGTDHGWVLSRIGLDRYPLVRRTYRGRVVPNTPENVERYRQNPPRKGPLRP
jgi:hypothetical protein